MKITYEAEVTSILKDADGGVRSGIEFKTDSNPYSSKKSLYIPGCYELGAKFSVVVTDEPQADAAPDDAKLADMASPYGDDPDDGGPDDEATAHMSPA